ncbi:unnamed protein product [Linum tenue]|uniref:Uncharacterized protein n=1 Tax=Linum tenue TaxID=586396 RepID=A0AAV0L7L6_9ROSI|nr:unnamed protein product [Linum tenue]
MILGPSRIQASLTPLQGLLGKGRRPPHLLHQTTVSVTLGLDHWEEGLLRRLVEGSATSRGQVDLVLVCFLCSHHCSISSSMDSMMLLPMELLLVSSMGFITSMVAMPIGSHHQAIDRTRVILL